MILYHILSTYVDLLLSHRLQRWPNIEQHRLDVCVNWNCIMICIIRRVMLYDVILLGHTL